MFIRQTRYVARLDHAHIRRRQQNAQLAATVQDFNFDWSLGYHQEEVFSCRAISVQRGLLAGMYCTSGKESRIIARADSSDSSAPVAIACTTILPIAVASTGPARTGIPHASEVIWHRRVFWLPPPMTW